MNKIGWNLISESNAIELVFGLHWETGIFPQVCGQATPSPSLCLERIQLNLIININKKLKKRKFLKILKRKSCFTFVNVYLKPGVLLNTLLKLNTIC